MTQITSSLTLAEISKEKLLSLLALSSKVLVGLSDHNHFDLTHVEGDLEYADLKLLAQSLTTELRKLGFEYEIAPSQRAALQKLGYAVRCMPHENGKQYYAWEYPEQVQPHESSDTLAGSEAGAWRLALSDAYAHGRLSQDLHEPSYLDAPAHAVRQLADVISPAPGDHVVSTWSPADFDFLDEDGDLSHLPEKQLGDIKARALTQCSDDLISVLTSRGNEHLSDWWHMNKEQVLDFLPKNALGNIASAPFYVWANEHCDNADADFVKAKAILKTFIDEGSHDAYIVDADGVEVADAEIDAWRLAATPTSSPRVRDV